MNALFYACFGLCIIAGAVGSQLRRLQPKSAIRMPVDGAFAVTIVALLSMVEGIDGRLAIMGAVLAGSTTLCCILMGLGERLVPAQRCIWFAVAVLSAGSVLLLFSFLHGNI